MRQLESDFDRAVKLLQQQYEKGNEKVSTLLTQLSQRNISNWQKRFLMINDLGLILSDKSKEKAYSNICNKGGK